MILLNFQIFTLVRKKHSTIFVHSDLKCPFIKLSINNEDDESNEEIEAEFQQWTTVDRTELISMKLSATEFIDLLIQKLDEITVHSFIA